MSFLNSRVETKAELDCAHLLPLYYRCGWGCVAIVKKILIYSASGSQILTSIAHSKTPRKQKDYGFLSEILIGMKAKSRKIRFY